MREVEAVCETDCYMLLLFCLQPNLPSVLDSSDGEQILTEALKTVKTPGGSVPAVKIFNETILVTETFLNKLMVPFKDVLQKKAEKVSLIIKFVVCYMYMKTCFRPPDSF